MAIKSNPTTQPNWEIVGFYQPVIYGPVIVEPVLRDPQELDKWFLLKNPKENIKTYIQEPKKDKPVMLGVPQFQELAKPIKYQAHTLCVYIGEELAAANQGQPLIQAFWGKEEEK